MIRGKQALAGTAALAIIGAGVFFFLRSGQEETESIAASGPPENSASNRVPVRVATVETRRLDNNLRLTGTLRADEAVALRAEISAMVTDILFREGEAVESGELLVKLDDRELRAELGEVEAELEFALREEERQRRLFDDGVATERQLDEAVNRRRVLESRRALLTARMDKTEIRAPFSGVIGLRAISPGALVQPDTRVASLQRLEPLKVDFSVPERHAASLIPGLRFTVEVPGNNERHSGEVYAREPEVDAETRTILLRGLIDNPDAVLLPGGFADVLLELGTVDEAVLVPSVAVIPGRESAVFVLDDDDTARRRPVELGRRERNRIQILDGLESGERLVVAGVQNIRDGQPVRVLHGENADAR